MLWMKIWMGVFFPLVSKVTLFAGVGTDNMTYLSRFALVPFNLVQEGGDLVLAVLAKLV